MNYEVVEGNIKASYRAVCGQYRRDDEIEVQTENHRHFSGILDELTSSFAHKIRVLEAGCGTGRYFHCLKNVEELVGLDVCEEMLVAARSPVREEEISAERIELLCGNIYLASFPPHSFDFIYSIGMFGNGCPVTTEILQKFHHWLRPGGTLFFNAVDEATLAPAERLRKKAKRALMPVLPRSLKRKLNERQRQLPFFVLTRRGLEKIMRNTRFSKWEIQTNRCQSPLWKGVFLECLATKARHK
jgi:ubiquinone/menaquinone biosynthesis C-methylase UbiE